jgi:hypothetical protein
MQAGGPAYPYKDDLIILLLVGIGTHFSTERLTVYGKTNDCG